MSVSQPLLQTIEADDPSITEHPIQQKQAKRNTAPVVLTPTTRTSTHGPNQMTTESDAESGV